MSIARLCLASAWAVALLAALSSPGHAQTVTLPLPQERPHVDDRGVDLTSGQVTASESDLSIGATGTVGLSHGRVWSAAFGWRHGYVMTATVDNPSTSHVTLAIGGASYGFTLATGSLSSSATFSSDQGDGAALSSTTTTFTYTARDGTVISFDRTLATASYYGLIAAAAKTITSPTGVTTTLTYKTGSYQITIQGSVITLYVTRLQSVATSTGYMLKYAYANNTLSGSTVNDWVRISQVMAINNAVDYCDPTADSCTGLSYGWPTVGYATSAGANNTTIESVTDPQGRVRKNTTDGSGRLLAIQRPTASSASLTYVYNSNSTVQSATVAGVGAWTYSFSTSGSQLTASVTNPLIPASRTVVSSTTTHQVSSDTDENGNTTTYTPDAYGRIQTITAPMGNKVTYAYDARGNVTSTTATAIGGGSSFTVSSASYPTTCSVAATCNQPTWTRDGDNNETDYYYNSDGTTSYVQQPAVNGIRPETHYAYAYVQGWLKNSSGGFSATPNAMDLLTSVTTCRTSAWPCATSDQIVTSFVNAGGPSGTNLQLLQTTTAAGDNSVSSTIHYAYDNIGNTTSTTDPGGNVTTATYNADRQTLTKTSPLPDSTSGRKLIQVQYQYQGDGLLSQLTAGTVNPDGSGWTAGQAIQTTYDTADRKSIDQLIDSTTAIKSLTQYSYDTANRPLCTATRMNPAAYGSLPDACTLSTQGSNGPDRILHYIHEYAGLESRETNGWGTNWQQDTVQYTHTSNGQVSTVTDAKGNVTAYAYDGYGRQLRVCYVSSATACPTATSNFDAFTYDNAGNRISHTTRAGQVFSFSYDALNRMSVKSVPAGMRSVYYAYDLQGHPTAAHFDSAGGADMVSAAYNALGETTSATTSMAGNTRTLSYQYDALGDVTKLTHPDGIYFTMQYDNLARMNYAWWTYSGGTVPFFGISYDNLGRRTATDRASSYTSYAYDSVSRLSVIGQVFAGNTGNVNKGFGYDPASGVVTQTRDNDDYRYGGYASVNRAYTANALNQYTAAGSATFAYDGNGNLTGDGTNTYGYDAENKLVSASTSGGTTLTYDPLGRLYQTASSTYGTTQFLYDGQHVVAEYNGSTGAILRRFMWGPGADEPILQDEGGAMNCTGTRFLHTDDLGSIVATADCFGNRQNVNTYDEYGIPGASNWGRFQYTGQAWIPDLGMDYYKARLYSPTLGRFMQTDPIGYGDGPNWYAYVHNNPVNGTDPNGTCTLASICLDETLSDQQILDDIASIAEIVVTANRLNHPLYVDAYIPMFSVGVLSTYTPQVSTSGRQRGPSAYPCTPTAAQAANSGKVTFKYLGFGAALGGAKAFSTGTFTTESGISGSFTTFYNGLGFGKFGAEIGGGWSRSLSTFEGENYNVSGNYALYSRTDSYLPNQPGKVGGSSALTTPGAGGTVTDSDTTVDNMTCSWVGS